MNAYFTRPTQASPLSPGGSAIVLDQPRLPFDRLYTIKQASEVTGIKYWLLMRAVNNGEIPFYRFGNKRRRLRLADIEAAITRGGG